MYIGNRLYEYEYEIAVAYGELCLSFTKCRRFSESAEDSGLPLNGGHFYTREGEGIERETTV